ncbi:MAG TPA: NAD(P)-dependent oxidoreductase [Geminicoccaceae bacterium]|nr:NAD(P)-dependent oxidoreductase [Geminicoccaceae bacterium]
MKVVMTGAAGGVASMIRPHLRSHLERLVLSDRVEVGDLERNESFVQADMTDLAAMEHLLQGADGLIHLGGQSVEGSWEAVLDANIIGLYNVYEAARRQGCRRIVFATTNHVVGFYRRQRTIDHTVMPRPDSRYGVSKAFGEALGRMYADKHGLRVFNIRIGNVDHKPVDRRRLSIWISPRDLAQLMRIGLEHPDIHFEVVYGISRNHRAWYDNRNAYRLGYRPEDVSEDYAKEATEADTRLAADPVAEQFQGGQFCGIEFSGDVRRVD